MSSVLPKKSISPSFHSTSPSRQLGIHKVPLLALLQVAEGVQDHIDAPTLYPALSRGGLRDGQQQALGRVVLRLAMPDVRTSR